MSLLAVPLIAISALVLVIALCIFLAVSSTKQKKHVNLLFAQLQAQELQINDLHLANSHQQSELNKLHQAVEQSSTENNQVSKQLEHRIKSLQHQLAEQQQVLTQIQEIEGQDKFYARAFKLAEKGADIEEIMLECELPRAEVEMLLSIYQQRVRP